MATTLSSTVHTLNGVKRRAAAVRVVLVALRALAIGAATVSLWSLVRPQEQLTQLALGGLAATLALLAQLRRGRRRAIRPEDLALALEMHHGTGKGAPLSADTPEAPVPPEWELLVTREVTDLRRYESRALVALASTLVLPVAVSLATLASAAPSFKLAFNEVTDVVRRLGRGATLRVVQGAVTDLGDKPLALTRGKPQTIELLAQNLVEVTVTGGGFGKIAPIVELRRPPGAEPQAAAAKAAPEAPGPGAKVAPGAPEPVFQSFQMAPRQGRDGRDIGDGDVSQHDISFAVADEVDLYIPAIDAAKPLAHIKVRQLPIPKVTLVVATELEDPWPDDQPLPLHIQVKAENPLRTVRLLIKSGQRTSAELVANVVAEDRHELATDYRLVLEQYVESDLAQVEIVAEAIDRAVPTPLVGVSEPIKINTASAYGRYRKALETLREIKTALDEAVGKGDPHLAAEVKAMAAKAGAQAEKSPYFDGLDRVQIHRIEAKIDEQMAEPHAARLLELSQTLNEFLFEHEILDDRERDRDFFVAARALSRLVEQEAKQRPVALTTVAERMRHFLDDRQERWTRRVERLAPDLRPERWPEVRDKKPFHAVMGTVEKLDASARTSQAARSDQMAALSKAVVDYRAWIEDLEAKEDKTREDEEKKHQEGLASARDTLRELQKRQDEIASALDHAEDRPKDQLDAAWPTTKMKQNTNSKEAHRLEGQMRSLAPQAGERIQAAAQAMERSNEAGNEGGYAMAETGADVAGRLLRQAESAAQQSQQKRRSRGRRRRVTGDNYYGQSVVGGDVEIKREYQVDRRYREDILDEVQSTSYDDENRVLLENYLRQVVR